MAKKKNKPSQTLSLYQNRFNLGGQSINAFKNSFNQDNMGNSFTNLGGALTSIVGAGVNNSKIADTTAIENNIQNMRNTTFSGLSNDQLMQGWSSFNPMDNVLYNDIRGGSNGQRTMNTLGSTLSGATAGLTIGGPIGAAVGGVIGLGSSLWGALSGKKKAKNKTVNLNNQITDANIQAVNNFGYNVGNADTNTDLNLLSNYMAEGGELKERESASKRGKRILNSMGIDNKKKFLTVDEIKQFKRYEDIFEDKKGKFGGVGVGRSFITYPYQATDSTFVRPALVENRDFNSAFGNARKSGTDTFLFNGKEYNTEIGNHPNNNSVGANRLETNMIPLDTVYLHNVQKKHSEQPIQSKNDTVILPLPFATEYNKKAYGGHTNGTIFNSDTTFIDEGGTHEENPMGGVMMGVDAEGVPNMVEEGEVKWKDYIFSNRLTAKETDLENMKLPKSYNNKTYGDIAKKLGKESEERPNDPISKNGLESSMNKLVMLQENDRAKEANTQQSNVFDIGGPISGVPLRGISNISNRLDTKKVIPSYKDYVKPTLVEQSKGLDLSALRYAPVLGSAINSITDLFGITNKPDYSSANMIGNFANTVNDVEAAPIGNYLTYNPLDRNYYTNQLNSQFGATRRDIVNQSGGNRATATAGLLAADYNATGALGKMSRESEEYNANQRERVSTFNRATNMFNAEQNLRAAQLNQNNDELKLKARMVQAQMMQQEGLTSSQARSANLSNLFNSIGDIGREEFSRNMILSNPALYYDINRSGTVSYKDGKKKNGGYLTIKKK